MRDFKNLDSKTFYELMKSTSSKGSNLSDGIRGGNFPLPGIKNQGRGVTMGNLRTYTIMPDPAYTIIYESSPLSYIPISSNYIINGERCLKLDFPRTISLSSTSAYTNVIVSGFDILNQKVVCSGNPNTVLTNNIFLTERAFAAITSIQFTPTVSPITISLTINMEFELPFNDLGNASNLINIIGDDLAPYTGRKFKATMLYKNVTSAPPALDFVYTPATWGTALGANTGTPRPLVDLTSSDIFSSTGVSALTFLFSAFGFPNLPNYIDNQGAPLKNPKYMKNDFNMAYGQPNYNIGWKGNNR